MIKQITEYINSLYEYYQTYTVGNTDYRLLSNHDFKSKIFDNSLLFGSYIDNELNGMISLSKENDKTYVTLLYGEESAQIELLRYIEEEAENHSITELWFHFFNPVTLQWYPLPQVTHPGKPGVDISSKLYEVLIKEGYTVHSVQEVYYLNLNEFKGKYTMYQNKNLSIDYYNPKIHSGYEEFAEKINAPHWKKVLLNNINKDNPLPMLVALDNMRVIGFAGPLKVEDSQRGYFAGIGILEEYRGQKLGKYLFNNLCMELKNIGAKYMTLFTGENNLAKYIYMNAGFKVVKQFATMKKNM